MQYSRDADLIIIGQHTGMGGRLALGADLQEHFLLDAGRPILVAPSEGRLNASFKHIAIAWNGSREAARAVSDALPLLERASQVTVLAVNGAPPRVPHGDHDMDILAYLSRYSIRAQLVENIGAAKIGEWLLERAGRPDVDADLVVSGAYGHHRLGEHLLGGVTYTLLREACIPMLMSH